MTRWIFSWIVFASLAAGEPNPEVASKQKFIENGKIKIGVDLSSGGSIFWFSEVPGDRNLMNHADRGQDLDECRMEEWITLSDKVARIRFRFSYHGKDIHPPTHQELPAVFVDYALTDLVYYKDEKPWTNQPISQDRPGWPNESRQPTENWAGFIGPDGRGVGVLFPGTDRITTYRHPGPPGPIGGGCSYFAPIRTMSITPGLVFEYDIYLTIGSAEEMRSRFMPIALKRPAEPAKSGVE